MSFAAAESSRFKGEPIELYQFVYGNKPGSHYAYTNAEQVVDYQDVSYRPIPIERDAITAKGTLDQSMLRVRMPKTTEAAEMFRVYPPSSVVSLIIRQGHVGSDDFRVCHTGRIINIKREGNQAVLGSEPIHTAMRRNGLRRHYQYSCPHALYGTECRAAKRLFPARVTAISGTVITLGSEWQAHGISPEKFVGGLVEFDGVANIEPRTILQMLDATNVLMSGFIRDMEVGSMINLALGCDHQLNDCDNLHRNTPNFGGCAWIPTEVPFGRNIF